MSISISSNDVLYIGDTDNNRVVVVVNLHSTTNVSVIGSVPGSNSSQFIYPNGLFIINTLLYVIDTGNNRVQKSSLDGSNPTTVFTYNSGCTPKYLYVDNNSNIYLTCSSNNTVLRFPVNSIIPTIVAGTGIPGTNNDQLNTPCGIFVNDLGTIYVADRWNHRIMKWLSGASNGSIVAGNGTPGSSSTQLNLPTDVIVDTNGYMYISDRGNARIIRWGPNSASGECIAACTGVAGIASTQLFGPHSLAFDSNGSLYVCEWDNNRVQKFQLLQFSGE